MDENIEYLNIDTKLNMCRDPSCFEKYSLKENYPRRDVLYIE